jgi:hypothetical protein
MKVGRLQRAVRRAFIVGGSVLPSHALAEWCWPRLSVLERKHRVSMIRAEFEQMAAEEKDPKLRADLEKQAQSYRKLAEKRAKKYKLPMPPQSK